MDKKYHCHGCKKRILRMRTATGTVFVNYDPEIKDLQQYDPTKMKLHDALCLGLRPVGSIAYKD